MDVECLDLCLSCGSHVADGTPYCSTRCRSADSSSKMSSSSSRHHQYPSSVYYNQPYASSSSASSRRPRLDLGDYYHQSHHEEHLIQHSKKLASIQEWAKGVWGDAGDAATATSKPRRSSHSHHTSSPSSSTKAKSPSPSARYNAPRFTLTAQHLAPPAMSIAHSSSDDDNSSIHTPSTCSISPPTHSHAPKRFSSEGSVDPWISSPPYEFAYNHFFPTKKGEQQPERGRTLLRV